MGKASQDVLDALWATLQSAASGLPKTAEKSMFGCKGLFANDQVFALVWKEGRMGVRLPHVPDFEALMGSRGAAPWKAGPMTMSHWVLMPESMADERAKVSSWVKKAHAHAISGLAGTKRKKPAKEKAATGKTKAKAKPVKAAKTPNAAKIGAKPKKTAAKAGKKATTKKR